MSIISTSIQVIYDSHIHTYKFNFTNLQTTLSNISSERYVNVCFLYVKYIKSMSLVATHSRRFSIFSQGMSQPEAFKRQSRKNSVSARVQSWAIYLIVTKTSIYLCYLVDNNDYIFREITGTTLLLKLWCCIMKPTSHKWFGSYVSHEIPHKKYSEQIFFFYNF